MMDGLSFLHPVRVHIVWIAFAIVALLAWADLQRHDTLGRFVSAVMQLRLAQKPTIGRRLGRLGLILAMLVLGTLALMRPQTHTATELVSADRVSADVMVVLDVSKSMLAEDAAPNRLSRAKAEITDLVSKLRGHRIGLVAFAGRATVLCPLTPDYGFFRMILRGVDTTSVSRGGTRIGDALRKATDAFAAGEGAKMILLITDGEDHDSYPKDAAKSALEAGIAVVAIGFGSEEGSEITLSDPTTGAKSVLTDRNGNVVHSRLDGETLREIALLTQGAYVPAGVAALDLESIVREHIKPIVRSSADTTVRVVPGEQYPWLIVGAMLALFGAVWLSSFSGRRRSL